MSNAILISNNIPRGRINAFNPETGQFLGPLSDASGQPIEIDDVWALQFGQGGGPNGLTNQLFFTAGPNNYAKWPVWRNHAWAVVRLPASATVGGT